MKSFPYKAKYFLFANNAVQYLKMNFRLKCTGDLRTLCIFSLHFRNFVHSGMKSFFLLHSTVFSTWMKIQIWNVLRKLKKKLFKDLNLNVKAKSIYVFSTFYISSWDVVYHIQVKLILPINAFRYWYRQTCFTFLLQVFIKLYHY